MTFTHSYQFIYLLFANASFQVFLSSLLSPLNPIGPLWVVSIYITSDISFRIKDFIEVKDNFYLTLGYFEKIYFGN